VEVAASFAGVAGARPSWWPSTARDASEGAEAGRAEIGPRKKANPLTSGVSVHHCLCDFIMVSVREQGRDGVRRGTMGRWNPAAMSNFKESKMWQTATDSWSGAHWAALQRREAACERCCGHCRCRLACSMSLRGVHTQSSPDALPPILVILVRTRV
jgi:hypothetical protein